MKTLIKFEQHEIAGLLREEAERCGYTKVGLATFDFDTGHVLTASFEIEIAPEASAEPPPTRPVPTDGPGVDLKGPTVLEGNRKRALQNLKAIAEVFDPSLTRAFDPGHIKALVDQTVKLLTTTE